MTISNEPTWFGAELADGFHSILDQKLVILVGVTGVGKTTTVNAIKEAGLEFDLLPNRRDLTDTMIIGELQKQDGEAVTQVTDRSQRFDYTHRYRELYPGGMAHALTQIAIANHKRHDILFFDGLRGENEVSYAADWMPNARFLVLSAPHFVRLQRLLGRGDAFDAIQTDTPTTAEITSLDQLGVEIPEALFSKEEQTEILGWIQRGELSASDVAGKLAIVLKERASYDPDAAERVLKSIAPDRTIIFDTTTMTPEEIGQEFVSYVR